MRCPGAAPYSAIYLRTLPLTSSKRELRAQERAERSALSFITLPLTYAVLFCPRADWASWAGERPKPQRKRSRRKRRRPLPKPIDGLYGARTLVLDDGTVMYSTPGWGPWASEKDVRPGGIEMTFTDMASVFGAVSTGAHVYVY